MWSWVGFWGRKSRSCISPLPVILSRERVGASRGGDSLLRFARLKNRMVLLASAHSTRAKYTQATFSRIELVFSVGLHTRSAFQVAKQILQPASVGGAGTDSALSKEKTPLITSWTFVPVAHRRESVQESGYGKAMTHLCMHLHASDVASAILRALLTLASLGRGKKGSTSR